MVKSSSNSGSRSASDLRTDFACRLARSRFASERLTAWEAVRYGAGDLMHKNVIFRAVYTGCRFGEPLTLKPEYNQHLFYFPGIGGEWSVGASHWSHVVAYYGTSYYLGKWMKNNVIASRSFLYPITED